MSKFPVPRSILLAACLLSSLAPAQMTAQAPADKPATPPRTLTFDVATVKPLAPDGRPTHGWSGIQYHPDGMEFASQSLSDLLCFAYGYGSLRFDGQITGLPNWANAQRYDIGAKMSAADIAEYQKLGKDQQAQWREAMTQALLAERFHLTLHRGSKQVSVYELVVAKASPKLVDATTDPNPPLGKGEDGKPHQGVNWARDNTSTWQAYAMQSLADFLSMPAASVGRPVVDKTGLTGTYDFTLDWSIYSARAAAGLDPTESAKSIFSAVGEIGLKLQSSSAPMQTLVIDHAEPPTAN